MSDHQALATVVWRESPVILGNLFDETTGREIFGAVLEKTKYDLNLTDDDAGRKEILIGETNEHCIALLLQWAKADLSTGTAENSRAVGRILDYFEAFIMKMVRKHVSRPCDIDPVANDARWRVCRNLETFTGKRLQLQSYVSTACWHAAIDHYRRGSHITVDGERRPVEITSLKGQEPLRCHGGAGDEYGTVEVRIMLQKCWHLLSHNQQVAVWAFLVYEGSWLRAEADLGIPRQTLQSRFESALKILRRWFTDGQ